MGRNLARTIGLAVLLLQACGGDGDAQVGDGGGDGGAVGGTGGAGTTGGAGGAAMGGTSGTGGSSATGGTGGTVAGGAGGSAGDVASEAGLKGATIEVTRNGTPLMIEPLLRDFDYGYQRDFVFGKYTIAELATIGDDEVGVVFSDGNLYDNSTAIKVRLNLSQGRIFEVAGGPGTPNTTQHPGVATKELSADKNTLVLYTFTGKMLDTGNGRAPTAEDFSVTIRNLYVKRQ